MSLVFFDTEFLQDGSGKIDLVSIGLVKDTGETLYCESNEFNEAKANDFVKREVLPKLGPREKRMPRSQIKDAIIQFVGRDIPTWVAYNASYDGVCLFELFGTFENLPQGWPNSVWDLKQDRLRLGKPDLPNQDAKGGHNALADAMWLKDVYWFLHGRYGLVIPQQTPVPATLEGLDTYTAILGAMGIAPVVEAIGDNTVDNLMADLARCTTIELAQFVAGLLTVNVNQFEYAYSAPQYTDLAVALANLCHRYRVMDGKEQGDLCTKVTSMMKDIFATHYAALGPEAADAMAMQYADHMIAYIKSQNPQIADLASNPVKIY